MWEKGAIFKIGDGYYIVASCGRWDCDDENKWVLAALTLSPGNRYGDPRTLEKLEHDFGSIAQFICRGEDVAAGFKNILTFV